MKPTLILQEIEHRFKIDAANINPPYENEHGL